MISMGISYIDDTTALDLDQCLMENKERHRSPIIHLPEIFMYEYSYSDVLECANNFKSCSMDKTDDPVVNTVNYYNAKYKNKINPNALNAICDIIYENAYSIFHIDKGGTTYLMSLNSEKPTVCIDSVCLNWNQLPDTSYDMIVTWKKCNPNMSFDEFSRRMFNKFHDDDYVLNKSLKNIIDGNSDRCDSFNRMPSYSYAMEDAETYNLDDNFIETMDHYKVNEFELSPATEAPADDGISELEQMSGNNTSNSGRGRRGRSGGTTRGSRRNPVDDLEDMTNEPDGGTEPDRRRTPTTNDDTDDGEVVDVAQMTRDRMEENGEQTPEDQASEDDLGEGEGLPEGDEEGGDEGDEEPTEEPTSDDDAPDEENTESDEEKEILNNPESKEVYRKRFIALYKHINDIIDTLERFSPAYNVKSTNEYYTVQNDIHRLKTAIYKICTEKIQKMETVDVMKAYLTANYAYDSIGEILKDFFKHYHIEQKHAKANIKSNQRYQ